MTKRKTETKVLYIVIDTNNTHTILKYLSKVQNLTNINKATLSKHFLKYNKEYKTSQYIVIKCTNVDLKGYFKNNF